PARPLAEEDQPDLALAVVAVGVDEDHRLPGAEGGAAVDHRDRHRRGNERRQHVVPPVAGRAVGVAPPVVGRQELVDGSHEVVVGAGPELDDGHAGGGVRDEHRAQAVSPAAAEVRHGGGEVEDAGTAAGADLDGLGGERHALSPRKISETELSMKIAWRASATIGAIDSTWIVSRLATSSDTGRVLVTITSSTGAFLIRSMALPEKMAWVAAMRTDCAPLARTSSAAFTTVPAVSIMSSTITACLPSTSPVMSRAAETLWSSASRRL